MSLGNRIYTRRSELGLSQGALAEKLGVSRQAVSKWENDSAVPELEKLCLLAKLLGVSLDQLAAGEDMPPGSARQAALASGMVLPLTPSRIAGALLICAGLAGGLLCRLDLGRAALCVLLPGLLCGAACLCTKRGPAFWCGWALYLMLDAAVAYRDETGWWALFQQRHGIWGIQRFELAMWLQFLGMAAALTGTVLHVRRKPLRIQKRLRRRLAADAWFCAAVLPFLLRPVVTDFPEAGQLWVCVLAAALALSGSAEAPYPDKPTALRERISTLRAAHGLSQDALAERLGVSRQAVSKWETGRAVPELDKLLGISRQFGVSLNWLAGEGPATVETVLSPGQLAGISLTLLAAYELFRWFTWFGYEMGLLCPLLLMAGGAACLFFSQRAWLWCAWTAGLLFNALVRTETLSAGSRYMLIGPRSDLRAGILELAVQLILLLLTLYSCRREAFSAVRRVRFRLWGSWALLEGLIWLWVIPGTAPRAACFLNHHVIFRIFADDLSLFYFSAALVYTLASRRRS